jgi:hypothetical protein
MKNTIVLDLDGVIADIGNAIEDWVWHNQGIDRSECNYGPWLITDSKDPNAMDIFNNPMFWKNMKPYADAWHQINYWFSLDYDVHIVTARRCEAAMTQTQPWLDFWRINTMKPIFTNIHEKHEIIEKINPAFVVEDNPNEVAILRAEGIDAYLRKQWYNEEFWKEFPTIETLYDLDWN